MRHEWREPMGIDGSLAARDERAQRAALRDGVLECGRLMGWPTYTTIAFAEGLARRPWKRCTHAQLLVVLDELQAIRRAFELCRRTPAARGPAVRPERRDGRAPGA